jgi:uncharacterized protein YfaS (alpha-2-macroglobulin family)
LAPGAERSALALKLNETPELKTPTTSCARNTASAFPILASTRTQLRRACFQFTEALPKRTDFSPFVAVAGQDKPALSVDDQQLCVEGLNTARAIRSHCRRACPRPVGENLLKTADFTSMCATAVLRCGSPARLSAAKTGQQGIPLVSVNTDTVKVTIYRIGDRNLLDTVLGGDFERNLYGYTLKTSPSRRARSCVDRRDSKVEKELNAEITTNFPRRRGRCRRFSPASMCSPPSRPMRLTRSTAERATQWFMVSDLDSPPSPGLTASTPSSTRSPPRAGRGVELRLIARNNEVLALQDTMRDGRVAFEPGFRAAKADLAPAHPCRLSPAATTPSSAQVVALRSTDRGVAGRDARRASMPSCSRSAASTAPRRPCMSRRACAMR